MVVDEMMGVSEYWGLISLLNGLKGKKEKETLMLNELQKFSRRAIIGFKLRTDYFLYKSYTSEL